MLKSTATHLIHDSVMHNTLTASFFFSLSLSLAQNVMAHSAIRLELQCASTFRRHLSQVHLKFKTSSHWSHVLLDFAVNVQNCTAFHFPRHSQYYCTHNGITAIVIHSHEGTFVHQDLSRSCFSAFFEQQPRTLTY